MNLYRLDYESPDGTLTPVIGPVMRDYLTRYLSTAREDALRLANETGAVIRITRISGAGTLTPILRASGETHRIHRVKR